MIETTETLVKTMESILEEREASRTKEKEAVESLNAVLERMGYQIVPLHQDQKRPPRRNRISHLTSGGEVNSDTDSVPRRRGRPRKAQAVEEIIA